MGCGKAGHLTGCVQALGGLVKAEQGLCYRIEAWQARERTQHSTSMGGEDGLPTGVSKQVQLWSEGPLLKAMSTHRANTWLSGAFRPRLTLLATAIHTHVETDQKQL